ncbi:Cytochrome P450 [Prauserella aidingensis]|uniref:cytochrome P450 n=1 Tax=Prauserella aidingensis TaxID=387890 RepID=UPI0020A40166|nr:cytochrome P450 [Prauserella aidingensis]MCP2254133.1 Cytochrome P450 [Prauserella aidingensis]
MTTPDRAMPDRAAGGSATTARAIPTTATLRADEPHPAADTATLGETTRVAATVLLPAVATGLIRRRPAAMQMVERYDVDRLAVTTLRKLRRDHRGRPVRLRRPGRSVTVLLDHADVGHLLAEAPTPFSPATLEKRAALSRFQPHGVLISEGDERAERRDLNEDVLEPAREVHHLAGDWAATIASHVAELPNVVDWAQFADTWWRLVREITLGGDTVDDREITALLTTLRQRANWAYLVPKLRRQRTRLLELVQQQVASHRPGSLASVLAASAAEDGNAGRSHGSGGTGAGSVSDAVASQLLHWLFAFDAAGIATFRTLALLAAQPDMLRRAREEARDGAADTARQLPFLRACVLESLRLWPTTPALLREARTDTAWARNGATLLAFAPLFHRDSARLPYADRFAPDVWLDGRAAAQPALVPFSAGPAACPGRDVVLFTTATFLAAVLREREPRLDATGGARLDGGRVPASLNHFALRVSG